MANRRLTLRKRTQKKSTSQSLSQPEDPLPTPEPDVLPTVPLDLAYSPSNHDARSSSVTPPPMLPFPKKSSTRRRTAAIDISDSETEAPAKKARKKEIVDPAKHELVIMIPRAQFDGNQRQVLTHAMPFDKALKTIHDTLGCADIPVKPQLTYKLSTALAKAQSIGLGSAGDWRGLLDEVTAAEKKKTVTVDIIVSEQYLMSLRTKLNIKGLGMAKNKGKGKAAKIPILDLEHAGSGDDDFDEDLGIMDKEKKFVEQLQAHLGRCQRCGPDTPCKIDTSGDHCKLSNKQLMVWATALAHGTHNVTLHTPPNCDIFAAFFKNSHKATSAVPASHPLLPQYPPYLTMNPYSSMMPWPMPPPGYGTPSTPAMPTPLPRAASTTSGSKLSAAFPSSDPPDMGASNPYPAISLFLQQLDVHAPHRNLLRYLSIFDDLDFYNIDEIMKLGAPAELVRAMSDRISLGNATHIMEQVKAEMKRIDRAEKSGRASA
ncbi:hypothetical protein GGX14DRAFT_570654 [Mycena pura]|uniref:Uncharacterized protein n=1 Tax=Mycena pura TaxID=153505 RepID=A0AAD6YAL3_9AGAR|nr:hypothetical protein GGX14DRAFT_570654 [Mycena pura]